MFTTCTAETRPTLGALHDEYRIAQNERRYRDASELWRQIQRHTSGPGCGKEQAMR